MTSRHYTDEDEWYWVKEYYIDVFKRRFGHLFDFVTRSPNLPAVSDLFRTVERKYAFQKGALQDLLGNEEEEEEDGSS